MANTLSEVEKTQLAHRILFIIRECVATNNKYKINVLVNRLSPQVAISMVGCTILCGCAMQNNYDMMEFWYEKMDKYDLDENKHEADSKTMHLIKFVVSTANSKCMLWLLENRKNISVQTIDFEVNEEDAMEFCHLLHQHNVAGEWRTSCLAKCTMCKSEKVWDSWVMENREFDSSIQWLPMEMMENVLDLVMV